jgi:predicted secreted Zn-dependent protease
MKVIFWLVIPCLFISIGMLSITKSLNYLSLYAKTFKQEAHNSPLTSEDLFPNPEISVEEEYYEIDGKTDQELYRNIFLVSPINENGETYAGYTSWSVSWNYWWKETPKDCTISNVKTFVKVKYTLPSWSHAHWNSHGLERKWKTYSTALRQHEEGHSEFGIKAATKIQHTIKEMGPRNSCSELEHAANLIGEEILEEYMGHNRQYDIETDHGKTQGATWN